MPVFRLIDKPIFPSPEFAEPDGLLAVGGDLEPVRLLAAYSQGIFPWFSAGDPILWWSPSPRLVLFPEEFHLPRRLARTLRQDRFILSADTAFAEVIHACATAANRNQDGTWISAAMEQAYCRLHRLGFAHSVECWRHGRLVGGLYGVCLDRVFFGESMFSLATDGSKVALAALVQQAVRLGVALIDCQMTTAHLQRFGAREVPRDLFQAYLETHISSCLPQGKWHLD